MADHVVRSNRLSQASSKLAPPSNSSSGQKDSHDLQRNVSKFNNVGHSNSLDNSKANVRHCTASKSPKGNVRHCTASDDPGGNVRHRTGASPVDVGLTALDQLLVTGEVCGGQTISDRGMSGRQTCSYTAAVTGEAARRVSALTIGEDPGTPAPAATDRTSLSVEGTCLAARRGVAEVHEASASSSQPATPALQLPSVVTDTAPPGVDFINYIDELQMPEIVQLIQRDLSEPYSIYTYRYFINNWPKLCFLAVSDGAIIGAIVCKLDKLESYKRRITINRGYIAMLAVDKQFRQRSIGSLLVRKAIRAMAADGADEIVLETEVSNTGALRLYENLGFVRDKRLFRYYLNGVDAFRLKLWLWPPSVLHALPFPGE